jgi:uncharacterized protein YoxC
LSGGYTVDSERIFDLLERIYIDVQETKRELKSAREEVKQIGIKVDILGNKVKQLAEVQESHYEENKRDHVQIVEMLTERVTNVENALKNSNIKAVK